MLSYFSLKKISTLTLFATIAVRAENIAFKLLNPHSPQPEVQFIYAGKALGRFKVDVLPTDTPYFHWAYSGKRVDIWTKAGRVPIEEMENRTKGTGDKLFGRGRRLHLLRLHGFGWFWRSADGFQRPSKTSGAPTSRARSNRCRRSETRKAPGYDIESHQCRTQKGRSARCQL